VADPADQRDLVGLEPLPRAASVPEATSGHLGLHLFDRDLQPGGQSLDDDHECLAMGFAGGEVSKHRKQVSGDVPPVRRT